MKRNLKIFLLILSLLLLPSSALLIWGFVIEPNQLVTNNYELKLKKWGPALNGLKIVVISDIHAGSNFVTADKIRQIVVQANVQQPDLIVLLGDYVSPTLFNRQKLRMPLPEITESLRGFHAKYGVYAILGNVDEAFGKEEIRDALEKAGIKVLSNEVVSLKINGENLRLLGMQNTMTSDQWVVISDQLRRLLNDAGQTGKIIVLVHNPDYFPAITGELSISADLSLILAGHTHGGQVRLPWIGAPIVPSGQGQKYVRGHIRQEDTDMFITTGIGTSKIPVRFGVPPEIAVLNISAE